MIINCVINKSQDFFRNIYEKSYFLKTIDSLILLCILGVIFGSAFLMSDNIGYFAIFAIILTTIKLLTKPGENFELSLADKVLLIYFITVVISVAGSSMLYLSIKGFLKTCTYLGFYVSLIHYLKNNKDKIKYILMAIALCISFETIIAFIQNFLSVDEISGWQDTSRLNPEEVMTRVYGSLKPYNPNLFGGYMLAGIPSLLILPFINKKVLPFSIIAISFASAAIILTGCRGAYIGYFFEIILVAVILYNYLNKKYKKAFISFSAIISLFLFSVILSISQLRARIFSIFAMRGDSSNSFRFNVYNSCIDMFKDNWLLGIGVGNQNFREIYGLYMKTGFDALSAYNIYLEIAVESGIIALLAFIVFLATTAIKVYKFVVNNKSIESVYVIIAAISIIGMLVHGFVDTVFFRPQIQFMFWVMIGIIRGCYGSK